MTNCPECGIEMLQLQGWDFAKWVCFNPSHKLPVVVEQTWCHKAKVSHREPLPNERLEIGRRRENLKKRLEVVMTNWELISVVRQFLSGGWNPEIDERITKVKGEHL